MTSTISTKERLGLAALVVGTAVFQNRYQNHINLNAPHHIPLEFRDVNGDGINDRIGQQRVYIDFVTLKAPIIKETVRYGIKIDGQLFYLPKELFEEYQKQFGKK